jgi:hypothetical protein
LSRPFFAYFDIMSVRQPSENNKSLESWIWDSACSIRGAKDVPNGAERHRLPDRAARRVSAAARIKYKDYILPLISIKRLCLGDVEADMDILGKSFDCLIRTFAKGGGQGAGEWSGATWTAIGRPEGEGGGAHQFYTPGEVGIIMSRVLQPEPGMEIYDPTCGSGGHLIKCEVEMERGVSNPRSGQNGGRNAPSPLKIFGQEYTFEIFATFVPEGNRYLHNQRLGLIVDLDRKRMSKRFLFHVFNLPQLRVEAAKTSTDSKVKHSSARNSEPSKAGFHPSWMSKRRSLRRFRPLSRKSTFRRIRRSTSRPLSHPPSRTDDRKDLSVSTGDRR